MRRKETEYREIRKKKAIKEAKLVREPIAPQKEKVAVMARKYFDIPKFSSMNITLEVDPETTTEQRYQKLIKRVPDLENFRRKIVE